DLVELAVECDDSAVCRCGVGPVSPVVGFERRGRYGDPAWVGVLHDDARRLIELSHALQRGVRVGDVVEGELFALQAVGGRDARTAGGGVAIEGSPLMGIFSVAQFLRLLEYQRECLGEALR